LLHAPNLLAGDDRARLSPPFVDGGIRTWGEESDRNAGQYRMGNEPFDFVDHNPLDFLQIYSFSRSQEYWQEDARKSTANLWWRIYDLGYELEQFGSVDQQLSRLDQEFGGNRFERRVDGYGAKYCRI